MIDPILLTLIFFAAAIPLMAAAFYCWMILVEVYLHLVYRNYSD